MTRMMTLTALAVGACFLIALATWGYETRETVIHMEMELQVLRTEQAPLMPRLVQSQRAFSDQQLPVSFLLQEPECAQRLLDHLKFKNVRIIYPGPANTSAASFNGSTRNESPGQTQSSP